MRTQTNKDDTLLDQRQYILDLMFSAHPRLESQRICRGEHSPSRPRISQGRVLFLDSSLKWAGQFKPKILRRQHFADLKIYLWRQQNDE